MGLQRDQRGDHAPVRGGRLKLLLDSHALIWAVASPERLRDAARTALEEGANAVIVSAASLWELAIKRSVGRLELPEDFFPTVKSKGFAALDVTSEHALGVADLPLHHRDPFDRLLVAQAQLEDLTIVTRDPDISKYDVEVLAA